MELGQQALVRWTAPDGPLDRARPPSFPSGRSPVRDRRGQPARHPAFWTRSHEAVGPVPWFTTLRNAAPDGWWACDRLGHRDGRRATSCPDVTVLRPLASGVIWNDPIDVALVVEVETLGYPASTTGSSNPRCTPGRPHEDVLAGRARTRAGRSAPVRSSAATGRLRAPTGNGAGAPTWSQFDATVPGAGSRPRAGSRREMPGAREARLSYAATRPLGGQLVQAAGSTPPARSPPAKAAAIDSAASLASRSEMRSRAAGPVMISRRRWFGDTATRTACAEQPGARAGPGRARGPARPTRRGRR